jgi:GntR family transcriptional regulator
MVDPRRKYDGSTTTMKRSRNANHRVRPLGKDFLEKFGTLRISGLPKYIQLREALAAAIAAGYWEPGAKVPPEMEIARSTPFSLGTVQKAMGTLVEKGLMIRQQGRGTFVAEKRVQMDRPWHCRFADDAEGSFLPVYPKVVLRRRVPGSQPWARLLNPQATHFIQIDRVIGIGDEFSVYSKFYLDGDRFAAFLKKGKKELEGTNFKTLLSREFQVPITHMSYVLKVKPLPGDICRAIGVSAGTTGLIFGIVADSGAKNPVYYQEIYIPPNERKLHISDSSNIPDYWI